MSSGDSVSGGWAKWVVTLGGAGLLRPGPGTWGSLVATAALGGIYFGLCGPMGAFLAWNVSAIVGLIVCGALCVALGSWTARYFGRKDPGPCVIDEGAGICLTAFLQPIYPGWQQWYVLLGVFLAFRVFDISKPPPAKQLEKLPAGWGVLLDDLMAAVYANVVCQAAFRWLLA